MPSLGETITTLSRFRKTGATVMANLSEPFRLTLTAPSGTNPGELRMLSYVPPGLPPGAPLVVVLHGCTQNAAAYDHGSGWSTLAERHGFALLFPEQQRSNNASLCFNWFQTEDVSAGRGEVESIRQMTLQMVATHQLDANRVFVTGLSAGGAMAAAMLATAPGVFAGGAIIAGLPYGAAAGMMEAFAAMNQVRRHPPREWGDRVRRATDHAGRWPTVQIWTGDADETVNPGNATELAAQWADVMGLPERPDRDEVVDGTRHRAWTKGGRAMLETWSVPGLGHGTPILGTPDDGDADRGVGTPGPYMLASPIGSTWHLARSWGLLTQASRPRAAKPVVKAVLDAIPGPASVIEKAMRAAGLLK